VITIQSSIPTSSQWYAPLAKMKDGRYLLVPLLAMGCSFPNAPMNLETPAKSAGDNSNPYVHTLRDGSNAFVHPLSNDTELGDISPQP
jgi:hypothetical protein